MENNENKEIKVSSANKRAKKAERRDAKAARKAANKIEEKNTRPNNLLLGIMIFGVLIVMFGFVKGYNYFSKDASIEAYLEKNKDSYTNMMWDAYSTANITAEGNSMKLVVDSVVEGDLETELKEFYESEDGEKQLKNLAAYFLTNIKPNVRGFSGDITATVNLQGEELKTVSMTYKEAKKFLKDLEKEQAEAAETESETQDNADSATTDEATDDAAAEETTDEASDNN